MCYNAPTSLAGFLLGSLVIWLLAADVRQESMTLLCLWWQFVVFVQLAEFLVWIDQGCSSGMNRFATSGLNALLLSQPVVLYLLFSCNGSSASVSGRILAALTGVYVFSTIWYLVRDETSECTFPEKACAHLRYMDRSILTVALYLIVIVGCLCALVKPLSVGVFTAVGFLGFALISTAFCGQASVWCSFAVIGPLFMWAFCRIFDPYGQPDGSIVSEMRR
jgi:drug/metabolite transporter superfamily protein YnfA